MISGANNEELELSYDWLGNVNEFMILFDWFGKVNDEL